MVEWCQSSWAAWDLIGLGEMAPFFWIILCVAAYSRIQMLLRRVIRYVSGVLEGRSRRMRNGANIIGRIAGRATDYLTVNHSRMIQMHVSSGLDSLTHLEERVNLLLSTDLIAQDAVVTQVVLLMNIWTRCYTETANTLAAAHDTTLAFKRRRLVNGRAERVLALAWVRATDNLLWRLVASCKLAWIVWLHLSEIQVSCFGCTTCSLIIF